MINQALILGRVGKKETKPIRNEEEMTLLSIATSKKWKDKQGANQEVTTWHSVVCFHKFSDIAKRYVHVGDLVFVQGDIQHKKIEDGEKAGQFMYSIHAQEIKFIPNQKKAANESKPIQEKTQADFGLVNEEFDDDIPF